MTHEEMIAVIQAHKEGKTIEMKDIDGEWLPLKYPSFNFDSIEYRIKPEPHYRPFADAEEVMDAIKVHGDWVGYRLQSHKKHISEFNNNFIWLGVANPRMDYEDAFLTVDFLDGTPFGKLEDTK